jgi:hypothetical protein
MDTTLGLPDDLHDPRDDFRNGFVAGVTHLRAQAHPTDKQIYAATNELCLYRLALQRDNPCPPGTRPRSAIDAVVERNQYEHSSDGPNSSRWARRLS